MKRYRILSLVNLVLLIAVCLPQAARAQNFVIIPFLDCIEYDAATNAVTAHFGYENRERSIIELVVGTNNRFIPNPADKGQNTVFLPGLHQRAFSTVFDGNGFVVWTLLGLSVSATHNPASYCRASSSGAPSVTPLVTSVQVNNSTGLATATFGYFSASGANIGKGSSNYFSFSGNPPVGSAYPGDRGQPTQFQAGLLRNAFQVTFNPAAEPAIAWNLLGQTVVAVPPPALPTAALLELSGAVRNRRGGSVAQARLILTNTATLETARAQTNSFGHYRFADLQAGNAYLLEIQHKRYSFSPQIVQLFDTREDFNLTAEN